MNSKRILYFLFSLFYVISCKKDQSEGGLGKGLIAYYPFNNNANDESGNNYNLTVNGATLTSDRFGVSSRAYSFNGSNSQIQIPKLEKGDNLNEFTISIWVKPETVAPFILSFASKNSNINNNCFSYFSIFNLNGYRIDNYIVTQQEPCLSNGIQNSIPNPLGKWSNIVLVQHFDEINSNTTRFNYSLYFNGAKLLFGSNASSIFNPTPASFNYGGIIGCDIFERYQHFKGNIDDIRLYNRALADEEVLQVFNLQY